jgi:hypothetical protein
MPSKVRNFRKEYDNYHSQPAAKKQRAENNKARRIAKKKYGGTAIAGKDVAHKNNKTSDNRLSNLKIESKSKNRSFARTKTAKRK